MGFCLITVPKSKISYLTYHHHSCHLCHSEVHYHSAYDTQRPWFEHTPDGLPEHCRCVNPDDGELRLVARLQRFLLDAAPTVSKASWQC
ncbi:DUF7828 domain-containing protein [Kluyvera intermedia]|uniref:DUF7828 domain-containing protein n=1 Tax=Kluyvera intermedia TaxID=61648 RepID=UPI003FA54E9E